MYYLIVVKEDGASRPMSGLSKKEAEQLFRKYTSSPDVVYCHYAPVMGERINWYCRPE